MHPQTNKHSFRFIVVYRDSEARIITKLVSELLSYKKPKIDWETGSRMKGFEMAARSAFHSMSHEFDENYNIENSS